MVQRLPTSDCKIVVRAKNESLPTVQPHIYEKCHTICKGSVKHFPKMNGYSRRFMYVNNLAVTVH